MSAGWPQTWLLTQKVRGLVEGTWFLSSFNLVFIQVWSNQIWALLCLLASNQQCRSTSICCIQQTNLSSIGSLINMRKLSFPHKHNIHHMTVMNTLISMAGSKQFKLLCLRATPSHILMDTFMPVLVTCMFLLFHQFLHCTLFRPTLCTFLFI